MFAVYQPLHDWQCMPCCCAGWCWLTKLCGSLWWHMQCCCICLFLALFTTQHGLVHSCNHPQQFNSTELPCEIFYSCCMVCMCFEQAALYHVLSAPICRSVWVTYPWYVRSQIHNPRDALICRARWNACSIGIVVDTACSHTRLY